MHTVEDITRIFSAPYNGWQPDPNKYLGRYNTLLSGLFRESSFLVTFPKENRMEVVVCTRHIPYQPVLLFLMLDEKASWEDYVAADGMMKKLLVGADVLDIKKVHGVCVSGTRVAFYSYDREQQVITPDHGYVFLDQDLRVVDGAAGMVEVAEDVKRMCRELIGKLK
jgi:hypothetical protein